MFEYNMKLTDEQLEILNGAKGATMAKVMQTMVMFGEFLGAHELIPITHPNGHISTSFGIGTLKPLFEVMEKLIDDEIKTVGTFTVNPRPLDYANIKCNFIERVAFDKYLYNKQSLYESQLSKLGLKDKKAFTCTIFLDEVGNKPKYGDILSWAESSSVIYVNSVIGARSNRNSSMIELFGNILGLVPNYGLLLDEGRLASKKITLRLSKLVDAQALGLVIGKLAKDEIVYITGLDKHLGKELNEKTKAYLKDFGASLASISDTALYHIDNLTPEAKKYGNKILKKDYKTIIIDDEIASSIIKEVPVLWKHLDSRPDMCFIGCPHLSLYQLNEWTKKIIEGLKATEQKKVVVKTIMLASPDVIDKFENTINYDLLINAGVKLSSICPIMFTNNPKTRRRNIITNSNKCRVFSSSRYYLDDEIVDIIVGKVQL